MNAAAPSVRSRALNAWSPFLPALGAVAALHAYVLLLVFPPAGAQVPVTAPLAAAAFALLQVLLPRTRPTREHILSPLNWAVFAFFLQLVAMPLTISWAGMARGTLPYLPGPAAIEKSILLSILAFAAFSAGYAFSERHRRPVAAPRPPRLHWLLIVPYLAIGLAGILLRFGSFAEMFSTLGDPGRFSSVSADEAGSLRAAASTFMRPFLIGGIVLAWSAWIERRGAGASGLLRLLVSAVAGAAVIVVGATYAFNRGAFIVPLVALAAAYSVHVRRLTITALASTAVLLLVLSIVAGQYRAGGATSTDLLESGDKRKDVLVPKDPLAEIQVYASAPQFSAFLLEAGERGAERFSPRVLLGSLLYPVPILGKSVRDTSGPVIYNGLIYGEADIVDQIIPFEAEVWLSLGPAGFILAFLALGVLIGRLQRAFDAARSTFGTYALQFTAIWATFLIEGSLAVVSQVFVFFAWPIYVYAIVRPWLRSSEQRDSSPQRDGPLLAPSR